MVYLAGDNNLETFGVSDLKEMKVVGSTDEVAIVAEFDRQSDQKTRRYYLTAGGSLDADCIQELLEINTGEPKALVDFITWAHHSYPAQRYALILWNHGAGWKDEDVYRVAQSLNLSNRMSRGQVRGLASGKAGRALFRTTLERLIAESVCNNRAILFDDSSADFLDSLELKKALASATQQIGQPFDLLGFDACLMNMIEVDYQVRDYCRVVVGSQEIEPGDGWPYHWIGARLTDAPTMDAEALARIIVSEYVRFYRQGSRSLPVTQSGVRTAALESLGHEVDTLAHNLSASIADRKALGLIFAALRSAQSFTDRDYLDLAHFCQLLWQEEPQGKLGLAARGVANALTSESSPVIAVDHIGLGLDNAHGLSIYLPTRTLSTLYSNLDFAQRFTWSSFLGLFLQSR